MGALTYAYRINKCKTDVAAILNDISYIKFKLESLSKEATLELGEGVSLCTLYLEDVCSECPIYKKTGLRFCDSTPYTDLSFHLEKYEGKRIGVFINPLRKLYEAQIRFLESVLKDVEEDLRKNISGFSEKSNCSFLL